MKTHTDIFRGQSKILVKRPKMVWVLTDGLFETSPNYLNSNYKDQSKTLVKL